MLETCCILEKNIDTFIFLCSSISISDAITRCDARILKKFTVQRAMQHRIANGSRFDDDSIVETLSRDIRPRRISA